jgi:hypothetical protein
LFCWILNNQTHNPITLFYNQYSTLHQVIQKEWNNWCNNAMHMRKLCTTGSE